jgi:hypothetical protein
LRATNAGSSGGAPGGPARWLAVVMARWRTASGLRAGMPSPWRPNTLRSDGQVVPNSWAAALTLPSRSASWNARSASAGKEAAGLPAQVALSGRADQVGRLVPRQIPRGAQFGERALSSRLRKHPTQDGSTVASVAPPSSTTRIRVECWWSRSTGCRHRQSLACFGCTASRGLDDRALAIPPGGVPSWPPTEAARLPAGVGGGRTVTRPARTGVAAGRRIGRTRRTSMARPLAIGGHLGRHPPAPAPVGAAHRSEWRSHTRQPDTVRPFRRGSSSLYFDRHGSRLRGRLLGRALKRAPRARRRRQRPGPAG